VELVGEEEEPGVGVFMYSAYLGGEYMLVVECD
jgi:hypothetical protein